MGKPYPQTIQAARANLSHQTNETVVRMHEGGELSANTDQLSIIALWMKLGTWGIKKQKEDRKAAR